MTTAQRQFRKENRDRAERVKNLLQSAQHVRRGLEATDISDLLADIRHWCDANKQDFGELDASAYRHYSAEVVQARTGVEQL